MGTKINLSEAFSTKNKILNVPVEDITRNPNQPRKIFEEAPLFELAESIRACGIIQPLNLRKIGDTKYELVSGERRLKAAKLIGLKAVPCIILTIEEENSAIIALIENLQREDLTFFEEALAYEKLIHSFSFTQEELSFKLGKSQSGIANKIRLLRLSDDVKAKVVENKLTERHCRNLLRIEDNSLQLKVLNTIIEKNLNVLETERYIESILDRKQKDDKRDKRVIPLFRDIRIFSNTVKQAVDMMKKAGLNTETKKNETDDYIEYFIRIDKSSPSVQV